MEALWGRLEPPGFQLPMKWSELKAVALASVAIIATSVPKTLKGNNYYGFLLYLSICYLRDFLCHRILRTESEMSSGYCPECASQGVIWCKLKDQRECNGLFVFLCQCLWGKADRRNLPVWSKRFEQVYFIDRKHGTPDPKPLPSEMAGNRNVLPYHPKTYVAAGTHDDDELF